MELEINQWINGSLIEPCMDVALKEPRKASFWKENSL